MSSKTNSILTHSHERFINRETSWLAFNNRVLDEAFNQEHPPVERLNFLAITASNLDEFYMIRVAGLKDYVLRGITKQSIDGKTPAEELEMIQLRAEVMVERQHRCWMELENELESSGLIVIHHRDVSAKDKAWLEAYFIDNIFPVLTPISIDPAHPFPFLPNKGLALIFQLRMSASGKDQITIVPLARLPRFIRLPGSKPRFVLLEETIEAYFSMLLPGFEKIDSAFFRIIRDSDLDLEEDANQNFVRYFEKAVKQRQRGRVIQIKFAKPASRTLVQFVAEQMDVALTDVIEVDGMLGLSSLRELVEQSPPEMRFAPFQVRFPERINDFGGDCFAAIAAKDIVIHHPFETFDVVVQFIRQAAADPDVVSIKQTLYRTSKDSPVARALIAAAEAGKSVTALVELKARFDEEANLQWARDLERAGVQVVYGFVTLKTHAKIILVTRREGKKLVSYAHFGTGNYHPNTAKIYTDLSFFTCDPDLCRDAAYLFNYITGYAPPKQFKKLVMAPRDMRSHVLGLIDNEMAHVRAGRAGNIWAKMNSLVDREIIDALYKASQAGVVIELVVRGICCLRPGIPGLSENIRVKSIVGRFLEHSRIYCFGDGHALPDPKAKLYISSADWMTRNFDWRVEVMVPIENPTVHEQIMGQIMMANLKDETQSWVMQPDGTYKRVYSGDGHALSAHDYFIKNPSLSGRGKALKKVKSTQMLKNKPIKKSG
ncbi:MAG: RNA degradosome polyphosphate kinase [Rickettsiales bacterium]|jgi:polyphosphate kinase|nr:RNA degradosome polyphosphate kinase [Rickettsiales bacterium]